MNASSSPIRGPEPALPGAADVEAAARAIAGQVVDTPCLPAVTLSSRLGCELYLKFENLQFTASFKERGALNRLLALSPQERARGVVAMSAGNHAQGVAYHAVRLGIKATIFMPRSTPFTKVSRTQVLGADVRLEGDLLSDASAAARAFARDTGAVFVHPYDDPLVVAGQGTVALEMLQAVPDLDALVVPVGGGGLIAGMAVLARARRPSIRIYGVESEVFCAMYQRLHGQEPSTGVDTVAEGLAVQDVGVLPLAIARTHVDEVLVVSEADIEQAVAWLADIEKTVVEGAGAAGLAALLRHGERLRGMKVGVPLTGGNIDMRLLSSVLLRGLAKDGRLTQFTVQVPDRVGSLARLTDTVSKAGANIIEIGHDRLFGRVSVRQATVQMLLETRDADHAAQVLQAIRDAGFLAMRRAPGAGLDEASSPPAAPA